MKHLSTFDEVTKRSPIYKIEESELQPETFIIIFEDGSQANCDRTTMNKLCLEGVWTERDYEV